MLSLNPDALLVDSFPIESEISESPTVIESPITSTIPSGETWSACWTNGTDEC